MTIKISKSELTTGLKLIANIVTTNINPILDYLYIKCENGLLTITATNDSTSYKYTISNSEISEDGEILIKYKLLNDIVNKINGELITIVKNDTALLNVSDGSFSININTLDASDYPIIDFNYDDT
jgi:DNA polymerase III sliding clamp (beta) subunit (PCNA family)